MAKTYSVAVLLVVATLCLAAVVGVQAKPKGLKNKKNTPLYVEGRVYCDTCRVMFETPLSKPLEGAVVTLLCRNRTTEDTTLEIEAVTDKSGAYSMKVDGDYTSSICQVHLTKSPSEDCSEVTAELNAARILLSRDAGVVEPVRRANALGFMKKEALDTCGDVLEAMGFLPIKY